MVAMQVAPAPPPAPGVGTHVKRSLQWIDEYTSPRPCTAGNFAQQDYVQSLLHAAEAGYAFMGLRGVGVTAAASLTSTWVVRHTGSRAAGVLVGAVTGGAAAAAMAGLTGAPMLAITVGGTMLGGLQSMRGDRFSAVRDSSGGATMITGLFLPGTAKIAGALAAGIGGSFDSPAARAAVGAATGAALGATLGLLSVAPGGVLLTAGISAIGGGIGPFLGPRFSQFFRNLANDCGRGLTGGLHKIGVDDRKISETTANSIGAFPAEFVKEGIRSFINSDFNPTAIVVGGVVESIELIHIFRNQKRETPAAAAPVAPDPSKPGLLRFAGPTAVFVPA